MKSFSRRGFIGRTVHGSAQLPIDNAERGLDAELATKRKNDSEGFSNHRESAIVEAC
jgi:hypothetical protein